MMNLDPRQSCSCKKMISINLLLFVSNFLFSSQGTRTNRRYIVASVQYGTPKIPFAVSAGGVVRESSETRWQENRLLAALPEKERERLIPQLEILTLFAKETIYEAGEEMNYVYFPLDCIVVLISSVESKATVEVGLIGNEGLVGAEILMGAGHSTSQALILTEGKALRLPAAIVRKEAKRSSRMRESGYDW